MFHASLVRQLALSAAFLFPAAGASAGTVSEVINWGSIPIHAALTPDGRIMTFGSTPQDGQGGFDYVLWDPAKGTGAEARIQLPNGVNFNSFCVGGVIDPATGRLVLAGGAGNASDAAIYDYNSTRMVTSPSMAYPRYYGTLTTLPDGRILVDGGSPAYGNQTNSSPIAEIYNPGTGRWTTLPGTAGSPQKRGDQIATGNPFWYPHEYPIGNSRVFSLAGRYSYILNYAGSGSFSDVTTTTRSNWGSSSTSVMFRPGLLMQIGGGTPGNNLDENPGSNLATIYDLRPKIADLSKPITATDMTMRQRRHFSAATVLANGEVVVTGGAEGNNTLLNVANRIEIYNPDTKQWRLDAALARPRLYHSMALLMKDGRVLTGGGGAPGPIAGHDIEIYTPDYLLDSKGKPAVRPSIIDGPRAALSLGQTFRITADTPIKRVTIVKSGVATHSHNTDQRFFEAQFAGNGNSADVVFPNDAVNATPGLYMVFAFDGDGVPSVGKFVRLKSPIADTGYNIPNDMPTPKTPTGTPVPASGWAFCANENDQCPVSGTQTVRYGANGTYVTRTVTDGTRCDNNTFGDPVPGVVKSCEIAANSYGKFTTASGENAGGNIGGGQTGGGQTGGGQTGNGQDGGTSSAPKLTIGAETKFEASSWPGYLIRHTNYLGYISQIGDNSSDGDKLDSTFLVRAGLSNDTCYSLESKNYPGFFLRHENFRIKLAKNDGSQVFKTTATFCARTGLNGDGSAISFESADWPGYFIRHQNFALSIVKDDGSNIAKGDSSFKASTVGNVSDTGSSSGTAGTLTIASETAFQPATWPGYLIRHANFQGYISQIGANSSALDKADSTFTVRPGLTNSACYSLESKNYPGYYLHHNNFRIRLDKLENTQGFMLSATFCARPALNGQAGALSLESIDYPGYFIRHQNFALSIMKDDGSNNAKTDTSFTTVKPYN